MDAMLFLKIQPETGDGWQGSIGHSFSGTFLFFFFDVEDLLTIFQIPIGLLFFLIILRLLNNTQNLRNNMESSI